MAIEFLSILLLSLTLNLAGNRQVGLWDRDEPRYATCTREMVARGDWLYPTFNDQPRYHKPILIYWLMRFGFAIGGDNPFGARLVSAVAGTSTCLLTWWLGRRIFGREVGWLAGLALATVPIMVAESKLATTDATLALLVVAAQGCLWGLSKRDSTTLSSGFWVSMALATLLKGPVGPAFVASAGLVSWWWGGRSLCWSRLRWRLGFFLFLGLTAPWFLTVGWGSRGEFFRFAFQTQIVQRMRSGMEDHGGFPGYYPLFAVPMFYPWSALLPPAILAAWTRRRTTPAAGFLLGWIVGPWLLLECFQTKLIHYYLPSFPACALITSWLVVEVARQGGAIHRWRLGRLGTKLLGSIGIGGAAILGCSCAFLIPKPLIPPCLTITVTMAIGTLVSRIWIEKQQLMNAAGGLVVTWAVVMAIFGGWLLPAAEPFRFSRIVGERLAVLATETGIRPAMMTFQEPGMVYALGHPACDVRGYDEMAEEIRQGGPILIPLLRSEVVEMTHDPRFSLRTIEPISGFNVNKGKVQELQFAIVRSAGSSLTRSGQQTLVK